MSLCTFDAPSSYCGPVFQPRAVADVQSLYVAHGKLFVMCGTGDIHVLSIETGEALGQVEAVGVAGRAGVLEQPSCVLIVGRDDGRCRAWNRPDHSAAAPSIRRVSCGVWRNWTVNSSAAEAVSD
jgi:hypothetical protein